MKVKKYIAPSMPEAMKKIRNELGSEAVILNSKEMKQGGFLGMFKKKKIEVIAALDPNPVPSDKKHQPEASLKQTSLAEQSQNNQSTEVLSEIKQLKKMIELQKNHYIDSDQPEYKLAYQYLLDQEVNQHLALEIINTVIYQHREKDPNSINMEWIMKDTATCIEKKLDHLHFQGIDKDRKIIQFIGPTGVGKTTTLAKIAANLMLNEGKNVAFITMDTYRIAAIDQLKTYARILNIPLEVAYSIEDYQKAVQKLATYDLIFVDTAGRNFRDEEYVEHLKESLDTGVTIDTYLVLALTAKPKDLFEIYDQFHGIPIKAVIFTKVDETRQFGSLLNIALSKQIGISYLTNGQDVPNDILPATPKLVSELMVGEYHYE